MKNYTRLYLFCLLVLSPLLSTANEAVYDETVYYLPYPAGKRYAVSQGNNGTFSHFGKAAYAWDFAMPFGDSVVAARGGVVKIVRDWNKPGGGISTDNGIIIDHGDGTEATYLHTQYKSSVVKGGDKVLRGQFICRGDNTGSSTGPHLHFQVQQNYPVFYGGQSMPIKFSDPGVPPEDNGIPKDGKFYTSHNKFPPEEPKPTAVAEEAIWRPVSYNLNQNYPNPFNSETVISYQIASSKTQVSLRVYDLKGQLIKTLVDEMKEVGYYEVRWDGKANDSTASSGVYIYTLRADDFTEARKMILLR